jgi:secondary thiamine-phosphate synthase enzyme
MTFKITTEPLSIDEAYAAVRRDDCGAVALFVGTVRDHHDGKKVTAISYSAFQEMAVKEFGRIAEEAMKRWKVGAVLHRPSHRRPLRIGDASVVMRRLGGPPAEAFEGCRYAIETLRRWRPSGGRILRDRQGLDLRMKKPQRHGGHKSLLWCPPCLCGEKGSFMKSLTEHLWFETKERVEFINITSTVEELVRKSGVKEGMVLVNAMHITASVFINDDERGLHNDFKRFLDKLAPYEPTSQWRHNDTGEDNADAHLKRQLFGPRGRGRDHRRQARLRPLGADLLRRVRRQAPQARSGQSHRRMTWRRSWHSAGSLRAESFNKKLVKIAVEGARAAGAR